MLRSTTAALCLAATAFFLQLAPAHARSPSPGAASPTVTKQALLTRLAALEKRQTIAIKVSVVLRAIVKEAMPSGLPEADQKTWPKFVAHVARCADRIEKVRQALAGKVARIDKTLARTAADDQQGLRSAAQQMQEAEMSFNMQYLALQSQMQDENRQYTAVSNIMKTKHDTVKNSISNVR